ncbi:MAG: hypothetical protein JST82_05835 [Bacteroidetes bacterium]|nr:hypothetical protein [Bacteroidota bacterium]
MRTYVIFAVVLLYCTACHKKGTSIQYSSDITTKDIYLSTIKHVKIVNINKKNVLDTTLIGSTSFQLIKDTAAKKVYVVGLNSRIDTFPAALEYYNQYYGYSIGDTDIILDVTIYHPDTVSVWIGYYNDTTKQFINGYIYDGHKQK